MSMMVSFCAGFFPTSVLDEILNLIESISEGFPSYSHNSMFPTKLKEMNLLIKTSRHWDCLYPLWFYKETLTLAEKQVMANSSCCPWTSLKELTRSVHVQDSSPDNNSPHHWKNLNQNIQSGCWSIHWCRCLGDNNSSSWIFVQVTYKSWGTNCMSAKLKKMFCQTI